MRKLVLVGSGEFTPPMLEVDRYFLSLIPNPASIAILPTAAGQEKHPHKWVKDGINHFRQLGAQPFGIFVLKRDDSQRKDFLDQVKNASFVYFSGGDPGYLYLTMADTPLWKLVFSLYQKGAILAGSSAGGMVMGEYVLSNAQEVFLREEEPVWRRAFAIVPFSIIPHYDYAQQEKPKILEKVREEAPKEVKNKLLGIDEDTAILIFDDRKAKVLGQGKVHLIGDKREVVYGSGESLVLLQA